MFGDHCLKTYSNTQDIMSLSSGGSEFYWIVKVGSIGLGIVGILKDLGVPANLQINTDSSAAKRIASRRRTGRMRHFEVRELWLQERASRRYDLQKGLRSREPGIHFDQARQKESS